MYYIYYYLNFDIFILDIFFKNYLYIKCICIIVFRFNCSEGMEFCKYVEYDFLNILLKLDLIVV